MQFGKEFGSCLPENFYFLESRREDPPVSVKSPDCFLYVDWNTLKKDNSLNCQEIKNSLVDFKVMFLDSKTKSITVNVSDPHVIPLGFFYNAIGSKGLFKIQGENALVKNIDSPSFNVKGKQVWARPIHSIVKSSLKNSFLINAVTFADVDLIELTENCKFPDSQLDEESIFQLISIIFINIKELFGDELAIWSLSMIIKEPVESEHYKNGVTNSPTPSIETIRALSEEHAVNIALNCHSFQSSYFSSQLQSAHGGCNGIKSGAYGFHTALEVNPWWCLDLGFEREVGTIVCYNRTDAGMGRVKTLRIFISNNNNDWEEIYNHFSKPPFGGINTIYSIAPLVLTFKDKLKGRYLRFMLFDKTYFHLDEVEVYE